MTEPTTGIGAELRRARESLGLAVADVAQQLKFASRQIESLENERFDRLPGPTIARGMIRNYARLLNLDPEPLLGRMAPAAEATLKQPVPFSDSSPGSTLVYAGFSVVVLALVGVVAYYSWQQEGPALQFVAPAQPQPAPAEPAPAPAAAATPLPEVASAPPAEEKVVEKPQPVVEKEKPVVAAGGLRRIVLRCEEEAWLEVKDGAGRMLVSSLNPPGSERAVRGRGPFEIVVGNAAHVTLLVDDKPVDLKPHTRADVAHLTIK